MQKLNFKFCLIFGTIFLFATLGFFLICHQLKNQLLTAYQNQWSTAVKGRYGQEIFIQPNKKGFWVVPLNKVPARPGKLLVKKEDKYFYYHFGFNPISIGEFLLSKIGIGERRASSTISQQLVKILLEKELKRNVKNKIIEAFYTFGLETFLSKEEILKMYANSVYFGNRAQGLLEASRLYFNLPPDLLNDGQIFQLLATISSPTENNPAEIKNKEIALSLAKKIGSKEVPLEEPEIIRKNMRNYSHFDDSYFELQSLFGDFQKNEQLTIDRELSKKIREIVLKNLLDLKLRNANNAAAIVIKLPENEILTLIGSPDPKSLEEGYKINMLNRPRPIGSTVKPLIYLKAFEKGLRPYTLVEDREYKYNIGTGFALYPKNYDFKYRGEVSLHYALSNSLNVPTVKVLEYIGLEDFYRFLENDLELKSAQGLSSYQLGIALGGLETSLMELSKHFTIFPNKGVLKELKIYKSGGNFSSKKKIAEEKYIQLINKILSDRQTGIEQFGLKSNLNLFQSNYALKTGTSREFHDSWILGYTPDFLVGVWLGNSDNTPMDKISGQEGAGKIWAEIMELILNSEYNKKTPFNFNLIEEFNINGDVVYGLPNDNYEKSLNALEDKTLILNPHPEDTFLLEKNSQIILKAREDVKWYINGKFLTQGQNAIFVPSKKGDYKIEAGNQNTKETITIYVDKEEY